MRKAIGRATNSPFCRSRSAMSWKSWPPVARPVTKVVKPSASAAASTTAWSWWTLTMASASSPVMSTGSSSECRSRDTNEGSPVW